MASTLNPVFTGEGRIFINVNGSGCGASYGFYNCMKLDGLDKSLGDVESVYCPDPNNYDQFIEVATIKGTDSRWTSTLSGKLPLAEYSPLEELLQQGCEFDIQVHFGRCSRPDDFYTFDSALIIQGARLTSYALSTVTAISPDERAAIDETAAISAASVYRIFAPSVANVGTVQAALGEIYGLTLADAKQCGGACNTRSDGCQVWIATQNLDTDFLYSINGGITWSTVDAGTLTHQGTIEQQPIIAVGSNVYTALLNTATGYIYSTPASTIVTDNAPTPSQVYSVAGGVAFYDLGVSSGYVWAVGGNGASYVVALDRSNNSSTVIDAGTLLPTSDMLSVYANSDDNVLIGGEAGNYLYSTTFGVFTAGVLPTLSDIIDVHMIDDNNWLAMNGTGIYCTSDKGKNWTLTLTNGNDGSFDFYDDVVGYAHYTDGVYRTIDSGNTWKRIHTQTVTSVNNMVACPYQPNTFMSVGGNSAANSFIIKGSV